jgi:hypothetical protein
MTPQEKIRQFVIMARHDKAKGYEEALSMETEYKDNLYEWFYINTKGKKITQINNKVPSYNQGFKILGRPITALDVCWALNKKYVKKDYAPFYIYLDNFCYSNGDESHSSESLFEFPTIKPDGTHTVLEDWDNEICENIVKLIDL